jgi:cystathionine gamma-synthase
MGFTASPWDAWLAERGLHSLELRFDRASQNAVSLAGFLADLNGVRKVLYPTRADHPDHNKAVALLGRQGGNMVSFEIDGGAKAAQRLSAAIDLPFAPTLGDVATTVSHPASSSHRGLTTAGRASLGISDGFIRVSVGIEDIDRLRGAFAHAVAESQAGRAIADE